MTKGFLLRQLELGVRKKLGLRRGYGDRTPDSGKVGSKTIVLLGGL
ncbi:MAG TPA: hypothetical protein VJN71_03615 [Nitrososphaerales archaeon]|nr:hypothetical protein [Nitrososphaerales archaeon]